MQCLELVQRSPPFSSVRVTVENDLTVRESSLFRTTEVHLPLERLSTAPTHVRDVSVRWVVISATLLAILGSAAVGAWPINEIGEAVLLGILLCLFMARSFNAWQLSSNILLFKDRVTGNHLFGIWRSRPSMRVVDEFVENLRVRLEAFRTPPDLTREELGAWHAKQLHYLLESGVLLPEKHSAILRRLDGSFAPAPVVSLVKR